MDEPLVIVYRRPRLEIFSRQYFEIDASAADIIMWLHQKGFIIKSISGEECHDIGDDFYEGCKETNDIDEIISFASNLYGTWRIEGLYKEIPVSVGVIYINVCHGLYFEYPKANDKDLSPLFDWFEFVFYSSCITCYVVDTDK